MYNFWVLKNYLYCDMPNGLVAEGHCKNVEIYLETHSGDPKLTVKNLNNWRNGLIVNFSDITVEGAPISLNDFITWKSSFSGNFNGGGTAPTGGVTSVNGQTEDVILDSNDVGALSNNVSTYDTLSQPLNPTIKVLVFENSIPETVYLADIGIPEAPIDNEIYVRVNGGWEKHIDMYPIRHWYQATGTGFGTYGTNTLSFQGTQTDVYDSSNGKSYRKIVSPVTAGSSVYARESSFIRVFQNIGFKNTLRFRIADTSVIPDVRAFYGLQITNGFYNTEISANIQPMCGIGCDGADTNIHIFSRQISSGTLVKIDTGFAKTVNHEYLLIQERKPNSNNVIFTLKNITTGIIYTDTVVNNSANLTIVNHRNNNASAIVCGFEIQRQELLLSE